MPTTSSCTRRSVPASSRMPTKELTETTLATGSPPVQRRRRTDRVAPRVRNARKDRSRLPAIRQCDRVGERGAGRNECGCEREHRGGGGGPAVPRSVAGCLGGSYCLHEQAAGRSQVPGMSRRLGSERLCRTDSPAVARTKRGPARRTAFLPSLISASPFSSITPSSTPQSRNLPLLPRATPAPQPRFRPRSVRPPIPPPSPTTSSRPCSM